ncbi:hypothetical protein [Dyella koreensis]|uniref:Uncharacterized protein n=1 Tax=Dyella koreensis TaxID=311235 RepID=A0ABW8K4V3_9GAMM
MGDLVRTDRGLDRFATRKDSVLNIDPQLIDARRHGHYELTLRMGGRVSHDVALGVAKLHGHALIGRCVRFAGSLRSGVCGRDAYRPAYPGEVVGTHAGPCRHSQRHRTEHVHEYSTPHEIDPESWHDATYTLTMPHTLPIELVHKFLRFSLERSCDPAADHRQLCARFWQARFSLWSTSSE